MGLLIVFAVVAVLVFALVAITRRANKRDQQRESGRFWPQSPAGQIGAVVLVVAVVWFFGGMIAAAA